MSSAGGRSRNLPTLMPMPRRNWTNGLRLHAEPNGGPCSTYVRRLDADQYKSLLIFNVRHNTYRLIVKVDYRAKLLMVKAFLTHKEYDREGWKKWAP